MLVDRLSVPPPVPSWWSSPGVGRPLARAFSLPPEAGLKQSRVARRPRPGRHEGTTIRPVLLPCGAGTLHDLRPIPLDPRYRGRLGVVTHPLHSPKYGVRFVCGVRAGAGSGGETHVARRVQRCARPVTVRHAQRPVVRLSTRIADPASDQSLFAPHRATLRAGRAWLGRLCACWRLCSGRVCVYACNVHVLKNTGFGISRLAALLVGIL